MTAGSALGRLQHYTTGREALAPAFAPLWSRLGSDAEVWAAAVLELAGVNAGPGCLAVAARLTLRHLDRLAEVAHWLREAATLCRLTRPAGTAAALDAMPPAVDRVEWWRIMLHLARAAPESVIPACQSMQAMLRPAGLAGLEAFIATGIRQAGGKADRRRAFFALEDQAAVRALAQLSAAIGFAEVEAGLIRYTTALWGAAPRLLAAPLARRSSLAGHAVTLPEAFDVPPDGAPGLYRASLAHAYAHLAFGGARFPLGKLKPLQVALITTLEDARVEALAMQRFPGLRRLWSPYHVAEAGGPPSATGLLACLARGLFDPAWPDTDGLVAMGRRLFAAADHEDPQTSRTIGGTLGYEIGQQRLGFNARTYVVEPAYRDDGWGLWKVDPQQPPDAETVELMIEAARMNRGSAGDGEPEHAEQDSRIAPARPAGDADTSAILALYPEWDREAQVARPAWTTIRDNPPRSGNPDAIAAMLDAAPQLRRRVGQLVRGARIGRAQMRRRQADGEEIDLDAALEAAIDRRAGLMPDHRVHRSAGRRRRELAVALLLDVSASTGRRSKGVSLLDLQRQAVALLAEALVPVGDAFTVLAFASNGREDVRLTTVKGLDADWTTDAQMRLAGLTAGLSTRLGAALRHTGALMRQARTHRRLVVVMTDGAPFDVDMPNPADLAEDARHAVLSLKRDGVDVFGMILGQQDLASAEAIFGRASCLAVPQLDALPARLSQMYARLTRA